MSRGRRQGGSRAVCWPRSSGGKTGRFFPNINIAGLTSVSGMSHLLSLLSAFVLAVPIPRAFFLYFRSPPTGSFSLVLTVHITLLQDCHSTPSPGSLPGCPQAGSGASSELLHCPGPSLHASHTKSPMPRHRGLPVVSSVSPAHSRCSIHFLNESPSLHSKDISSFSSLLVRSGLVLLSDYHTTG